MIESIMYFGGGFLVASLLAIILISFVHQRAVRLTQRRLADAIPVSMAEIQADKDHLRAEFALQSRRLEMTVEQLKAKATAHLSEIARKSEAINLLKAELVEKTAVTDELVAKAKMLGGKLTQAEQENLEKLTAHEATARAVAVKDAEIANAQNIINALNHAADTQRVEVAVLKTQIEDLKSQIHDMHHATETTEQRLQSEQSSAAGAQKDLHQARQTIEMLHPQVARLEHELAAHANELESRAVHIGQLDTHIAQQNQLLRQREGEAQDLHRELAATRDEAAVAAERQRAAKTAVETQLQTANDMLSERVGQMRQLEVRMAELDRLVNQRDAEAQALNHEIATLKDEGAAARAKYASEQQAFETHIAGNEHALAESGTRIADFERQVGDYEQLLGQRDADAKSLRQEIAMLRDEAAAATASWHGQRTTLDGQLAAAHDTLSDRARRIEAFEQQVADFERLVVQRDAEAQALHHEIATLKDEAAIAAELWLADKASLEEQLTTLHGKSTEHVFRIEGLEQHAAEFERRANERAAEVHALQSEMVALKDEAHAAAERWIGGRAAFEAQLATAGTDLEKRASRIGDLETWIAERQQLLAQREAELASVTQDMASLQEQTATTEGRLLDANAALKNELRAATDNFTQAQADLAALNREAEATWKAERNENNVLRERISDIAAQIAHMTMTLEKSGSPIAAILADSGNGMDGGEVTAPRPGNLTDRIRAIASGASRVSTAS
jgi:chromosome segregation ATPase